MFVRLKGGEMQMSAFRLIANSHFDSSFRSRVAVLVC